MEQVKKSDRCSQSKAKLGIVTIDPICGITVAEDSERYFDFEAKRYLFCCDECKTKFVANTRHYFQENTSLSQKYRVVVPRTKML